MYRYPNTPPTPHQRPPPSPPSRQSRIADVAAEFYSCNELVVVAVKERFLSQPLPSGWRDLFYVKNDPNRHVCEAQVCHTHMLACMASHQAKDEHELQDLSHTGLSVTRMSSLGSLG